MKRYLSCSLLFLLILSLLFAAGCTQNPPPPTPPSGQVPSVTQSPVIPVTELKPVTKEELVEFVRRAVSYAKTEGREKAIEEFDEKNGSFFEGQLYIYAYDFNGITLAHPVNPEKIGLSRLNEKDAAGGLFIRDLRDAALNGSGFVEYYYINPTHNNTIEKKLGYVMKVDDTWWLGSGIYAGTAGFATQSPGTPSIPGELKTFVDEAAGFVKSNGRTTAIAEFNNLSGTFIQNDLYVFAYDYNGTTLAYPYRPDLIGMNRINATDVTGKYHIREMVTVAKNGSGTVSYFSENPFRNNATELKTSYLVDVDGTWFVGAGTYIAPGPGTILGSPVPSTTWWAY
jgi:polar amino acid transport system substrate-binding protein